MLRLFGLIGLVLITGSIFAQQGLPPVGMWREHLPYGSAIDVAGNSSTIYCATPYSLFTVNTSDLGIERLSKVTGLSETGISTIFYDDAKDRLVIAYKNSNIDILDKQDIINVPDIKQDNAVGNKTIYQVYRRGSLYYLSTGLGVVVLDGDKYEIKDSWFIGTNGNQVRVNAFSNDDVYYYAATDEGLKRTLLTTANPADHAQWQSVSTAAGLSQGAVQYVGKFGDRMLIQKNDSLFVQNGNVWSLLFTDGYSILNTTISGGRAIICQRNSAGLAKVSILGTNGTLEKILQQPSIVSLPRKAIAIGGDTWVADEYGGLSRFNASGHTSIKPNSPEATASGEMAVYNKTVYATAGEVNEAWNYQFNGNGIYILKEGIWNNINRYRYPIIDTLLDFVTLAIDKRDESVWAGSYGGGLLHIKSGPQFEIFKQGLLGAAIGDPSSYRVSGLAMDASSNLWISNFGAQQPLLVLKNDNSWKKFTLPFVFQENSLSQILIDDNNFKWIMAAKGYGLICFDDAGTIDNINDDRWKLYTAAAARGNLPDGNVLCMAKDKSGFIWVGTINGIGVIQCGADVFSANGCDAVWPIVQEGNFAGYLFNGQEVRSIAVDGADRKWIATATGVSLVSADGKNVIYRFTETNSPLLSNDVKKITIDNYSGEVFFATQQGICSFRSTATEARTSNSNVLVFPNPVPPTFNGNIAIRGLAENAIVKITEGNGRLVYQTRAFGGQAIWNGRDYQGRRATTGVYLVLIGTDPASGASKESAATKIIFIGK